jgi:hypothetical protein
MTPPRRPRARRGLQGVAAAAVAAVLAAGALAPRPAAAESCTDAVLGAEAALDIPPGLLLAMSLVESGSGGEPHAYAMNLGGRTVFASSPRDGERRVVDARGRLRAQAFVGCLQLSVRYHRRHFASVADMLDPWENARYGASYLRSHFETHGDWGLAVERYQGGTARQRLAYRCKIWRALDRLDPISAEEIASPRCGDGRTVAISRTVNRAFLDNLDGELAQGDGGRPAGTEN